MIQLRKSAALCMLALLAGLALAAPATAKTTGKPAEPSYTSSGSCAVTDVVPTADACFGTVLPEPSNDSNINLNTAVFGGATGLFGRTEWDFLTKVNTGATGGTTEGTNIGLTLDPDTGGAPGSWKVNAGSLTVFDYIAIVLKQGNTWAAYLFDGAIPEEGRWSSVAFDQSGGLSHFSIYTGPRIAEVPLPAAGFLLLGALGGLGIASRRRKRA